MPNAKCLLCKELSFYKKMAANMQEEMDSLRKEYEKVFLKLCNLTVEYNFLKNGGKLDS